MGLNAIPTLQLPNSWQDISIKECHEKLVALSHLNPRIHVKPMYYLAKIPNSLGDCYLREEAADLLQKAVDLLPKRYTLIAYDGYRPYEVQMNLYKDYFQKLAQLHPKLNEEELNELVKTYVSLPSLNEHYPSTHLTGGAIDLTLADSNGEELNLGTPFDDFTTKAHTRYFEEKMNGESLQEKEEEYLNNRRLLFHILTEVGFVNYPNEWWHFDYGNQWWASRQNNKKAKYGLISLTESNMIN